MNTLFIDLYLEKIKPLQRREDFNLTSIETIPKIQNTIFFGVKIFDDPNKNKLINNIFAFFMGGYLFRKLDNQMQHYLQQLNHHYNFVTIGNESAYDIRWIEKQYKSFDIKIQDNYRNANQLVIEFEMRDEIQKLEIPSQERNQIKLFSTIINQQSNQIAQLYFYSCEIMINWMQKEHISIQEVDRWGEFLKLDLGW